MDDDPRVQAARRRLYAALESSAREAGATESTLRGATAEFAAVAQQVVDVVGGSAQRVDKQMVASLQDAARRTDSALSALSTVVTSARAVR